MSASISKSFIWSFLEQGSAKAVTLVVQIVLARLLTPEAFGVLAILLVVINVADAIAQGGLGSAIVQQKTSGEDSFSTAFWLSIAFASVLFIAILVVSPYVEAFYGMDGLSSYLNVLSIVVFFNSANSIQRSILQRTMDFRSLFISSTIAAMVSGLCGIGAALGGLGVWALILQSIIQSIVTCFVMAAKLHWFPAARFSKNEAIDLFSYGWKVAATSLLNVLYTGISDLIVGRACAPAALGYYSQGRKYPMSVIMMATNSIQNVMFPSLAQRRDHWEVFRGAVKRALVTGTYVIAPIALFCAVAAESIISLLLTDKWLPCTPIFQMVCISHSILMLTLVNLRAYMALGRSDLYLKLQAIKVLTSGLIICGTVLVTRDIYLTSFATCVTTLINTLLLDTYCAKGVFGYSAMQQVLDIAPTLGVAIAAAVPPLLLRLYFEPGAALLVLQIVLYWTLYLLGSKLLELHGLTDCFDIIKSLKK